MRVTKRTNIAMRLLMYCAAHPGQLVTKADAAARCHASEHHMAQIVNQLGHLGYLTTQRGRGGGLTLGRLPKDIRIGQVFRDLEGITPTSECFADVAGDCPLLDACLLRPALARAADAFFATLDDVTLDGLVCGNDALIEILAPARCGTAPPERALA